MKILVLDIETAPAVVYAWGIHKQHLGPHQIIEDAYTLCFAAKWLGESRMFYGSTQPGLSGSNLPGPKGEHDMLSGLWALLDEADAVIHYNGTSFDMPRIRTELLLHTDLGPPTPVIEIDLWKTVRSQFKFMSNKLDEVTKRLGLGEKAGHEGFELWPAVMAGDTAAWKRMRKYNAQDVTITENLYHKLLPWIRTHPNVALLTGEEHSCPRCGGTDLERRGYYRTQVSVFQQWQCRSCKSYSRSARRTEAVNRNV